MPSVRMSAWAARNGQRHEARKYWVSFTQIDGFKPGDCAPLVIYNALSGTEGKSLRTLSQRTNATVFRDHLVLDSYDPVINLTLGNDGQPLFELRAYLIDAEGKEREAFWLRLEAHRGEL